MSGEDPITSESLSRAYFRGDLRDEASFREAQTTALLGRWGRVRVAAGAPLLSTIYEQSKIVLSNEALRELVFAVAPLTR